MYGWCSRFLQKYVYIHNMLAFSAGKSRYWDGNRCFFNLTNSKVWLRRWTSSCCQGGKQLVCVSKVISYCDYESLGDDMITIIAIGCDNSGTYVYIYIYMYTYYIYILYIIWKVYNIHMLNNKDIYMYNLIGTTNRTYMKHVYQRISTEVFRTQPTKFLELLDPGSPCGSQASEKGGGERCNMTSQPPVGWCGGTL